MKIHPYQNRRLKAMAHEREKWLLLMTVLMTYSNITLFSLPFAFSLRTPSHFKTWCSFLQSLNFPKVCLHYGQLCPLIHVYNVNGEEWMIFAFRLCQETEINVAGNACLSVDCPGIRWWVSFADEAPWCKTSVATNPIFFISTKLEEVNASKGEKQCAEATVLFLY